MSSSDHGIETNLSLRNFTAWTEGLQGSRGRALDLALYAMLGLVGTAGQVPRRVLGAEPRQIASHPDAGSALR
jgi:hypothetical protein